MKHSKLKNTNMVESIIGYIESNYIRSFTFSDLLSSIVNVGINKKLVDGDFFIKLTEKILGKESKIVMERILYIRLKKKPDIFYRFINTLIDSKDDVYDLTTDILERFNQFKSDHYFITDCLLKEELNFCNDLLLVDEDVRFRGDSSITLCIDKYHTESHIYEDIGVLFKYLENTFKNFNTDTVCDDYFKQSLDIFYDYFFTVHKQHIEGHARSVLNNTFLGRGTKLESSDIIDELMGRAIVFTPNRYTRKVEFFNSGFYLLLIGYLWELYLYKFGKSFKLSFYFD